MFAFVKRKFSASPEGRPADLQSKQQKQEEDSVKEEHMAGDESVDDDDSLLHQIGDGDGVTEDGDMNISESDLQDPDFIASLHEIGLDPDEEERTALKEKIPNLEAAVMEAKKLALKLRKEEKKEEALAKLKESKALEADLTQLKERQAVLMERFNRKKQRASHDADGEAIEEDDERDVEAEMAALLASESHGAEDDEKAMSAEDQQLLKEFSRQQRASALAAAKESEASDESSEKQLALLEKKIQESSPVKKTPAASVKKSPPSSIALSKSSAPVVIQEKIPQPPASTSDPLLSKPWKEAATIRCSEYKQAAIRFRKENNNDLAKHFFSLAKQLEALLVSPTHIDIYLFPRVATESDMANYSTIESVIKSQVASCDSHLKQLQPNNTAAVAAAQKEKAMQVQQLTKLQAMKQLFAPPPSSLRYETTEKQVEVVLTSLSDSEMALYIESCAGIPLASGSSISIQWSVPDLPQSGGDSQQPPPSGSSPTVSLSADQKASFSSSASASLASPLSHGYVAKIPFDRTRKIGMEKFLTRKNIQLQLVHSRFLRSNTVATAAISLQPLLEHCELRDVVQWKPVEEEEKKNKRVWEKATVEVKVCLKTPFKQKEIKTVREHYLVIDFENPYGKPSAAASPSELAQPVSAVVVAVQPKQEEIPKPLAAAVVVDEQKLPQKKQEEVKKVEVVPAAAAPKKHEDEDVDHEYYLQSADDISCISLIRSEMERADANVAQDGMDMYKECLELRMGEIEMQFSSGLLTEADYLATLKQKADMEKSRARSLHSAGQTKLAKEYLRRSKIMQQELEQAQQAQQASVAE